MEDFFDRLDKYMKSKGLNDNQVTIKAGLSIGSLGKQRKGSRGLSSDSIAKILLAYTDINPGWLITGIGNMANAYNIDRSQDNLIEKPKQNYADPPSCERCKLKDEIIESLRQQIYTQSKFIDHLEEEKRPDEGQKRKAAS